MFAGVPMLRGRTVATEQHWTSRMRIEGTLSKWNDDRGFGFITPTLGGQEIFVHISTFPKDGVRPTLGEKLTFEIETDSNGKKRAKNLACPERRTVSRPSPAPSRRPASDRRNERPGFFARVIPLLVVMGLVAYGYGEYNRRAAPSSASSAMTEVQASSQAYACDGRTHCSQMTSCAEATFFLRNCPNVQMDGNNDGVPCEQQWCTSPFARWKSRLASTNSSWSPQSPSVAGSTPSVDWYVGYVGANDDVWVFALNLATRDATDLPLRIQIAKDAVETVQALPPK